VYAIFRQYWTIELQKDRDRKSKKGNAKRQPTTASLSTSFIRAFGAPFAAAGVLKLVHDSCLFVGPLLLNRIIQLLSDPKKSVKIGYYYVFALFLANLLLSLCLRQYFWYVGYHAS
jgi:hypothetical protein